MNIEPFQYTADYNPSFYFTEWPLLHPITPIRSLQLNIFKDNVLNNFDKYFLYFFTDICNWRWKCVGDGDTQIYKSQMRNERSVIRPLSLYFLLGSANS